MQNWIIGFLAVLFWVIAIWIYLRWSNANFELGNFEPQAHAISTELNRLRAIGDQAALEKFLKATTRKWKRVGWLHQAYAGLLEEQGRFGEGVSVIRGYVSRVSNLEDENLRAAADEVMMLARLLHRNGRTAEAEKLAENMMDNPLSSSNLSLYYAEMAQDRGEDDEAMRRYGEAVERRPEDVGIAMRFATELLSRGREPEAEASLRLAMVRCPRGETLALIYARLAHDRGDYQEAAQRWADVRENFVFNLEAYDRGAEALRNLGQDAEAEKVLAARPRAIGDLI